MLTVMNVRKAYGSTQALDQVSLTVAAGEIHAIVGENGSGKSTLAKIIGGVVRRDAGEIVLDGESFERLTPGAARRLGIAVVFQEVSTVLSASVVDNVYLGFDSLLRRKVSFAQKVRRCGELMERLAGKPIDPLARVEDMDLSDRQWIAVARSLVRSPRVLILDESTAALDLESAARLFVVLGELKAQGVHILLVTHRITELEAIADRATVLRNGRSVALVEKADITESRLLELMAGRPAPDALRSVETVRRRSIGSPRLTVDGLELVPGGVPFSAAFRAGEITGVAGLDGQGQGTVIRAIAGIDPPVAGSVSVWKGDRPERLEGVRMAARSGIVYIPGDRRAEGILPHQSILENFGVPSYRDLGRWGVIDFRAVARRYETFRASLSIKAHKLGDPITTLSGGNQQKVVVARWLARDPQTIILNDPTRGVDIGAKRDLYRVLRGLADEGRTIVFLSTEIEELIELCDRTLVFRGQTLAAELPSGSTTDAVVAEMFGVDSAEQTERVLRAAAAGLAVPLGGVS